MTTRKFSALVVSQSEKAFKTLSDLLMSHDFSSVYAATGAGKARRMALDMNVDFVVINTPLSDDFGMQIAIDLAEKNIGVLLLVKNELYDQVSYKVEEYGVITLSKPISKPAFLQSIKLLKALKLKIEKIEVRTQTLESKMKEIRLVNRAKWILISQMKMSEEEAHRYIEKSAMDSCVSKGSIAANIIKTYEV